MSIEQRYGWFLKHVATGKFVCVQDPWAGAAVAVDSITDATRYDTLGQARDVADFLALDLTFPSVGIVDATIPVPPPVETEPCKSAEEMKAESVARRAAAAELRRRVPLRKRGYGVSGFGRSALASPLFTRRDPPAGDPSP